MTRHLLDLSELAPEEAIHLLELSQQIKRTSRAELLTFCPGYRAALIFEKPSTRTRVSLEIAVSMLGAKAVVLSSSEMQLSRGEEIRDTARVLARYVDAVAARVNSHRTLEEMAAYSEVPLINTLSDEHHPLQALADVFTLYECLNGLNFTLAYVGDGNNVCHSLIMASGLFGFRIRVSTPKGYEPRSDVIKKASSLGRLAYEFFDDPFEAVRNADAVYTDTWVSMGFDSEREKRLRDFQKYQVRMELLKAAGKEAFFMHCLPAHKGEEVTEEVFESRHSIVFKQAENRLYTAAAVLLYFWKEVRQ
jgi:ornithine carbamoyltransferase